MGILSKHLSSINVGGEKVTTESPTVRMPDPETVHIFMSQHIGPPCKPLVAVGDHVKAGQKIGDNDAYVCAPIHTGVSGTVLAIEKTLSSVGVVGDTVVISVDKKQEMLETIAPPVINSREDFLKAVRDAGLVGLGGAAFPTHVKFNPPNLDEVDTLVINGAECEPYITSDYRAMMEDTEMLLAGIRTTMHYLGIEHAIIGIESNKEPAISKLKNLLKDDHDIEVFTLKHRYPKGAERVIIYETTGRVIPVGKLPADAGVLVSNVSTMIELQKFIETGMPLVRKRVTVDGNAIKTPKNVDVLIGTPIKKLVEFCDGYRRVPRKIIMGGPMMGRAIFDDDISIIKNNNAILAFDEDLAELSKETACINCGRCVKACPMMLMPTSIFKAYDRKDREDLERLKVSLCMECGSCSFVCPAKKQLSFINRMAKQFVAEGGKK